ncbi:MAG: hypothetical protein ACPG5U_01545 [Planktomarina sp.]
MTPSFLTTPSGSNASGKKGIKEMAMFGLRKAFIDPAPRPRATTRRMERFMGDGADAMDFFIPE